MQIRKFHHPVAMNITAAAPVLTVSINRGSRVAFALHGTFGGAAIAVTIDVNGTLVPIKDRNGAAMSAIAAASVFETGMVPSGQLVFTATGASGTTDLHLAVVSEA